MKPNHISLITLAPFGSWKYIPPGVISINSHQYEGPANKTGIQYWVIDRYNPTAAPVYSYFQDVASGTVDQVPAELKQYVTDDYIFVVTTQGIENTQVPQGELYSFLIKIGAGAQLEMLEQVNTYFACGFTGKIAYTLITVPGTNDSGLEFGLIPQAGYVVKDSASKVEYYYGSMDYPGATLIAQLVPTTFDGKTIYSPILTTSQSV